MKDATYWTTQFRQKKVSLPEYYQDLQEKIQRDNPQLNAFVNWPASEILTAAQQFVSDPQQPFAGNPFPLKMLGQEKAGWPATAGSRLLAQHQATRTANFVKKLEQVGLLAAGQTNAPEFGFKNITDPQLYGPARNPWDLAHSPGGSSGGAAAAVASGLVPMAGASDGGGSIRIPAGFTGLIGLKPTRGTMPTGPGSLRGWQGAAIDFAVTISMRDTETLFYALRGNLAAAPYQAPQAEWQPHEIAAPLKIAYITASPVASPVAPEAQLAVKNTLASLTELGHEVTEIPWPVNGQALIESYYLMNGAETAAMFAGMEQALPQPLTRNDMELITWGIYQYGKKVPVEKYIQALNLWDQAALQMEELFTHYDLLLTPTSAFPAPCIDQELQSPQIREALLQIENLNEKAAAELIGTMFEQSFILTPFTQLANMAGQPAISLPVHVTAKGLPLGVQFMAAKGREDLLFYIGKQLEAQQLFQLPVAYTQKS